MGFRNGFPFVTDPPIGARTEEAPLKAGASQRAIFDRIATGARGRHPDFRCSFRTDARPYRRRGDEHDHGNFRPADENRAFRWAGELCSDSPAGGRASREWFDMLSNFLDRIERVPDKRHAAHRSRRGEISGPPGPAYRVRAMAPQRQGGAPPLEQTIDVPCGTTIVVLPRDGDGSVLLKLRQPPSVSGNRMAIRRVACISEFLSNRPCHIDYRFGAAAVSDSTQFLATAG